jgi:hypothetical protein
MAEGHGGHGAVAASAGGWARLLSLEKTQRRRRADMDGSTPGTKRPESEVSEKTGLVGVVALLVLTVSGLIAAPPVELAIPLVLIGTALPMVLWSLLAEKVHRRKTTGLNFSLRHPRKEVMAITITKLIGLLARLFRRRALFEAKDTG